MLASTAGVLRETDHRDGVRRFGSNSEVVDKVQTVFYCSTARQRRGKVCDGG